VKIIRIALDEKLAALQITRYELSKRTGIKYQIIDNYYKNRVVRYDGYLLLKICIALDCEVGDILKIVERQEE
jgi:putative transcriptional regulator